MRTAATARRAACSRLARGANEGTIVDRRTLSRSAPQTRSSRSHASGNNLLHGAVALLHEVARVSGYPVLGLPPKDPADRPSVRGMMVGGDAQRLATGDIEEVPQEAPSRVLVARIAEHRVDQPAIPVDDPVGHKNSIRLRSEAGQPRRGERNLVLPSREAPGTARTSSRLTGSDIRAPHPLGSGPPRPGTARGRTARGPS